MTYNLIWKRANSLLNIPIGLATSVKSQYESDTLICDCGTLPKNKTDKVVKQKYVCLKCSKEYNSIGFVSKRFNAKDKIVYDSKEKAEFLKLQLDKEVNVLKEVSIFDAVTHHIEIINAINPLEIFSNDNEKFKTAIFQIWTFLNSQKLALLCEVKYRGDNFIGYIIATTTGKLILVKLKDESLIKNPYNASKLPSMYDSLNFSSLKKQKEKEFIELIKSGKIIDKKPIEQKVESVISEGFFALNPQQYIADNKTEKDKKKKKEVIA